MFEKNTIRFIVHYISRFYCDTQFNHALPRSCGRWHRK